MRNVLDSHEGVMYYGDMKNTPSTEQIEAGRGVKGLPNNYGQGWASKQAVELIRIMVAVGNLDIDQFGIHITRAGIENRRRVGRWTTVSIATVERALMLMRADEGGA